MLTVLLSKVLGIFLVLVGASMALRRQYRRLQQSELVHRGGIVSIVLGAYLAGYGFGLF